MPILSRGTPCCPYEMRAENPYSVNLCSIWRIFNVIQIVSGGEGCFDPTWYAPTAAGLANLEAHLAVACAALPVFLAKLGEDMEHDLRDP